MWELYGQVHGERYGQLQLQCEQGTVRVVVAKVRREGRGRRREGGEDRRSKDGSREGYRQGTGRGTARHGQGTGKQDR